MQEHPMRLMALAGVLALGLAYNPPLHRAVRHEWRDFADLFDRRPARAVLIVGNSRVYVNDMPFMIRDIADAVGDPMRWDVTSLAKSAATFESHWNDPEVHALLARRWDQVIIQAESGAQYSNDSNERFHQFGHRLVLEGRRAGSPVALVVGWVYGKEFFEGYPGSRDLMDRKIQTEHRLFAEENHVDLINVGHVWRNVESRRPLLTLTSDSNHPSMAGSYIEALAIYRYLSDQRMFSSRYRPDSVGADDAAAIVREVEVGISPKLKLRTSFLP